MRPASLVLTVQLLWATVALPGSEHGSAACAAAGAAHGFGFSPGSALLEASADELARELDSMVAAGAEWVRVDVSWAAVERSPGEHDWSATDRVVRAARDRELRILGVLAYSPAWAVAPGGDDKTPPGDPGAFAAFAGEAAGRYGDRVLAWEIWNEPNSDEFWRPRPDAGRYAELAVAAARAVRDAAPSALVVSGGLAPAADEPDGSALSPAAFLGQLAELGALDAFDAVAVHPYSYPARPTDAEEWNTFAQLPSIRALLARAGVEAPVWLTEYGAPSGPGGVPEGEQAVMLVEALQQASAWSWAGPLFVYSSADRGGPDPEHFGVVRVDGSAKPAWHALRQAGSCR